MSDANTLALFLCAVGVLLATCLVISAAFGAPRRRQGALRTTHVSASPNYVVLSGAETPPLVAKPYSEFDPLHWNKKPL